MITNIVCGLGAIETNMSMITAGLCKLGTTVLMGKGAGDVCMRTPDDATLICNVCLRTMGTKIFLTNLMLHIL